MSSPPQPDIFVTDEQEEEPVFNVEYTSNEELDQDMDEPALTQLPQLQSIDLAAESEDELALEEDDLEPFYLSPLFNIEHAPIFKLLDKLLGTGDVDLIEQQSLRNLMINLHQTLIDSLGYEKETAKKLRHLEQTVSDQRIEMERTGTKQFMDTSQLGDYRRELIKVQNEVKLAREKDKILHKEMEEVKHQEKELLNTITDIQRQKTQSLEPELNSATKELKLLLAQRKNQVENLTKDLEEKEAALDVVLKLNDEFESKRDKFTTELIRLNDAPLKLARQAEILKEGIKALSDENAKQTALGQQYEKETSNATVQKQKLEVMKDELTAEYEQRRTEIHQMEAACDEIFKKHQGAKEVLIAQKAENARLHSEIQMLNQLYTREHENLLKVIKEKDALSKTEHRLNATLQNLKLSSPILTIQLNESKQTKNSYLTEQKAIDVECTQLRQEIDMEIFDYLKHFNSTKHQSDKLDDLMKENRDIEKMVEEAFKKEQRVKRMMEEMNGERDFESKEFLRIQNKNKQLKDDLKGKTDLLEDTKATLNETSQHLGNIMKMNDVVKSQRNKLIHMIQSATQKTDEMKEKIKIVASEIEILRMDSMNKNRELAKVKQEAAASYTLRDSIKAESNKLTAVYREKRDQIDEKLSEIEKLNTVINATEIELISIKTRYASTTAQRDSMGKLLLDRIDELCVLYEKMNTLEKQVQNSKSTSSALMEENRKLKITIDNLKQQIKVMSESKKEKMEVEKRIQHLEAQNDLMKKEISEMSVNMEDPNQEDRCRYLNGPEMDKKKMGDRIQHLEKLLVVKEEKLKEKELVYEEVSVMMDKLKKQTEEQRGEGIEITQTLTELSKKLTKMTRKLMAKASELTMAQAMCAHLEIERADKEEILAKAKERLENNELPFESIEQDIKKMETNQLLRQAKLKELQEKERLKAMGAFVDMDAYGFYINPSGIRTKAEPRPNAYIPASNVSDVLPISKPYGELAPFKPIPFMPSLKHYRKCIIKQIEF